MDLARTLKTERVARLNPSPALALAPAESVGEAVRLMRERKVGCVLVCVARRVIGIFTERDLMRRILGPGEPLSTPLGHCMTPEPETVSPRDSIGCAIKKMQKGGYRHLPVVNDDGRAIGILSVKRIVHYLVEHFPAAVHNLPPGAQAPRKREGA